MKKIQILTVAFCLAIGMATIIPVRADEEHHDEKAKVKIPATAEGIFKEIHSHHQELVSTVKKKELKHVHHHAFAIRDLAKALPAKASADKKVRVEGTVKNITKLAGELDESGDAGDQAKTEASLKKFEGLIQLLETQFGATK